MYKKSIDPAIQAIKGVFILKKTEAEEISQTCELLKSMSCEILRVHQNQITITATRGKLQEIKACWLANKANKLSASLNENITKIIIGGNHQHAFTGSKI